MTHRILYALLFVFSVSCHSSVSKTGRQGLKLKTAEVHTYTTGANGFQGFIYRIVLDNTKDVEVKVLEVWLGEEVITPLVSYENQEVKIDFTKIQNPEEVQDEIKPKGKKSDVNLQILYRVGEKEYIWLIDRINRVNQDHEHLPN